MHNLLSAHTPKRYDIILTTGPQSTKEWPLREKRQTCPAMYHNLGSRGLCLYPLQVPLGSSSTPSSENNWEEMRRDLDLE